MKLINDKEEEINKETKKECKNEVEITLENQEKSQIDNNSNQFFNNISEIKKEKETLGNKNNIISDK